MTPRHCSMKHERIGQSCGVSGVCRWSKTLVAVKPMGRPKPEHGWHPSRRGPSCADMSSSHISLQPISDSSRWGLKVLSPGLCFPDARQKPTAGQAVLCDGALDDRCLVLCSADGREGPIGRGLREGFQEGVAQSTPRQTRPQVTEGTWATPSSV